jgi:predicted membrane chloride channel (bestrophin family)
MDTPRSGPTMGLAPMVATPRAGSPEEASTHRWTHREGEERPLLDPYRKMECYSLSEPHCDIHDGIDGPHISSYDVQKLTTFRVFFVISGTVLGNVVLWVETIIGACVFWSVWMSVYHFSWEGLDKFVGKEGNIRAFIAMFTTLVGLLLSFYTSMNINRWWAMRVQGVGGIWQACTKLTLLIGSGVTRDEQVLESTWRYACSSLAFIFMQRGGTENKIGNLHKRGLLTEAECQQMAQIPDTQRAEAVWTWLGNLVSQLNAQGLINGPPNYAGLMNTVDDGRNAANLCNVYLDTPVPMVYVHLLGLIVKLHNLVIAILMGILSAKHFYSHDNLGAFRTMFRAFFMPFLYNAILLINDDISDPFSGDLSDFPLQKIIDDIKEDAQSIVACGSQKNLPSWLTKGRKFEKWVPPGPESSAA